MEKSEAAQQTGKRTSLSETQDPGPVAASCALLGATCHSEHQFPSLGGGDGDSRDLPHRQTMGNEAQLEVT